MIYRLVVHLPITNKTEVYRIPQYSNGHLVVCLPVHSDRPSGRNAYLSSDEATDRLLKFGVQLRGEYQLLVQHGGAGCAAAKKKMEVRKPPNIFLFACVLCG